MASNMKFIFIHCIFRQIKIFGVIIGIFKSDMIVKDFSRRIRVSKCCGSEIDLDPNTPTQAKDEKAVDKTTEPDKKPDEPKPQTETQQI